MRKTFFFFSFLILAAVATAQTLNGIRINAADRPILVFFDGNQMSYPTTTYFITNLPPGHYMLEVYATRFSRTGERIWRGERLFAERVHYTGRGVKDIFIDSDFVNENPGTGRYPDDERFPPQHGTPYARVIPTELFNDFLDRFKKEPFESGKMVLLDMILPGNYFTCDQCRAVASVFAFDSEREKIIKKIYPRVVDRERSFTLINLFNSSYKKDIGDFMKDTPLINE